MLQLQLHKPSSKWSVTSLRSTLAEYIKAKEVAEIQSASPADSQKPEKSKPPKHTFKQSAEALLAPAKPARPVKCHFCKGAHYTDECRTYTTVDERKAQLQDRCFRCLSKGHSARSCSITRLCFHCRKEHHRSLCPTKFGTTASSHLNAEAESFVPLESTLLSVDKHVHMQTALSEVSQPRDKSDSSPLVKARLLFDTGSSRSYITEDMRRKLNLKASRTETLSTAGFGNAKRKTQTFDIVDVQITLQDKSVKTLEVAVIPVISSPILKQPLNLSKHPSIAKMTLAEPLTNKPERVNIDILVGSDYYFELILSDRISFEDGLVLLDSRLGLICAGKSPGRNQEESSLYYSAEGTHDPAEDIHRLWAIEEVGTQPIVREDAHCAAMEKFSDTVQFRDGRYYVSWPWRDIPFELEDNFGLAYGRLRSLLRRLDRDPELLERYNLTIAEQLSLGVIEQVSPHDSESALVHYLPHHGVFKRSSSTTKLRLVYDASAKPCKTSYSLNDCLLSGPPLLPDLCGILLRFRLFPVAIASDVEKAFLQIGLNVGDRDVTRFLWVKNPQAPLTQENLAVYRFCRVPFGVVSSPFLLAATVKHHLTVNHCSESDVILRNTYVDNLLTGKDSVEGAKTFYSTAKDIFSEASMNLREWCSNSQELSDSIPSHDKAKGESHKVLGLQWNTTSDVLNIAGHSTSQITVRTKRELLQAIAQFFDPLGFHAPLITAAKLLVQEAWTLDCNWDDPLPCGLLSRWSDLAIAMDAACEAKIPRYCSFSSLEPVQYELHVFCDASVKAYGVAAYLKSFSDTAVTSNLIFSKSRLAPAKPKATLTIPRMELLAAHMGATVLSFLQAQLPISIVKAFLWSDSMCVLGWINSKKQLPAFVERRLTTIRATNAEFRYVCSDDNPADLPSRGSSSHNISLWWHGPEWLLSQSIPPFETASPHIDDLESPLKKKGESPAQKKRDSVSSLPLKKKGGELPQDSSVLVSVASQGEDRSVHSPFGLNASDFSSLSRLVRVTAWVQRFINRCRKHEPTSTGCPHLTSSELYSAKLLWLQYTQKDNFSDIFAALTAKKKHNTVESLRLFIDSDGLLKCRGRLEHADLPEQARFPILLPSRSPLTSLIIQYHHSQLMHAGVTHTLAGIRSYYWILKGRSSVKTVLKKCLVCKKADGSPFARPPMAPLPPERVNPAEAFQNTGVDYFGPLYVKSHTSSVKVWTCLFTCLSTRAVHLELVSDMTAQQFLLAFRRFIARRGIPLKMWSDNAPQFKLTQKSIEAAWQSILADPAVADFISAKGTQWSFIVQHAPWMGGAYERMVGIVKKALRKAIGSSRLYPDQLRTFLTEAEAVVNSRPLVHVGGDLVGSNVVITPSHFLSLKPNLVFPAFSGYDQNDPDFVCCLSSASSLLQGWKKGQALVDGFWKCWRREYLLGLRERSAASKSRPGASSASPVVGELVLIGDEQPRGAWKMGIVHEVHQGHDGAVRAATVRIASGKLHKRPVSLLYPLECSDKKKPSNLELPEQCTSAPSPADPVHPRPTRKAALQGRQKLQQLIDDDLV